MGGLSLWLGLARDENMAFRWLIPCCSDVDVIVKAAVFSDSSSSRQIDTFGYLTGEWDILGLDLARPPASVQILPEAKSIVFDCMADFLRLAALWATVWEGP